MLWPPGKSKQIKQMLPLPGKPKQIKLSLFLYLYLHLSLYLYLSLGQLKLPGDIRLRAGRCRRHRANRKTGIHPRPGG